MAKKDSSNPGFSDAPAQPAPATDNMKMTPEEFAGLRAQVAAISLQDFHLGRFLTDLLVHLGHAHGLDATQEDARLATKAREDARAEEDAVLKTAADERAKTRTAEDAQARTPEQQAALTNARTAEDAQLKDDADALAKKRADEDAALQPNQAAPTAGSTTAPVAPASDTGSTSVKGAQNA